MNVYSVKQSLILGLDKEPTEISKCESEYAFFGVADVVAKGQIALSFSLYTVY
jgi:hypothetical protein